MPKIFESPDGGKTVYARDIGMIERAVVKANSELMIKMEQDRLWHDIRELGKTNPTMNSELERIIELYYLIAKDKK